MASKSELRDQALSRRDGTDPAFRAHASATIAARVLPLVTALAPRTIAAYVAMRSEADPLAIVEAAHWQGVEIGLPVIAPGTSLAFRRFEPGHRLVPGGFGTMIPVEDAPVVEPDLVIVPVVGFDREGTRLGYGKGHYDRAIAALRRSGRNPTLVGIAFSVQEVVKIPHEPHDVGLDVIATENETLDFRMPGHFAR